jgi:hypothetical protein
MHVFAVQLLVVQGQGKLQFNDYCT